MTDIESEDLTTQVNSAMQCQLDFTVVTTRATSAMLKQIKEIKGIFENGPIRQGESISLLNLFKHCQGYVSSNNCDFPS